MTSTFRLGNPHVKATVYHIHLRTYNEECLLGQTVGEMTCLNMAGQIAADEWLQAASTSRNVDLDQWTIFPNGLRALVVIEDDQVLPIKSGYGKVRSHVKPRSLTALIAGFKAATAKRINLVRGLPGAPVWQPSYHEQRIEDEGTLERIRQTLQG